MLGKNFLSTSIFFKITHELLVTNKREEGKYRKAGRRGTNKNEKSKTSKRNITN